ncbi:MAG: hypothetical protein AB1641_30210 [Thermodesulfobacteriota bacterium]
MITRVIRFTGLLVPMIAVGLAVMGMSGLGGSEGPTRIPTPDRNFGATIVDRADVHTQVTMFSIGGYTYFFGQRGKGQLAVPFELINRADFRVTPEGLEVVLNLKDGQNVILNASRKQDCFGRTSVGNFQITLENIKMIILGSQIVAPEGKK